jgi:fused signal recognition particle receptor
MSRLRAGLARTRQTLATHVQGAVSPGRTADEAFERIEEGLIACDVGVRAAGEIVAELRRRARASGVRDSGEMVRMLRSIVREILQPVEGRLALPDGVAVILVVGVNGVGKTTTVAKLAHRLQARGRSVILAACDTFRAAAVEQLEILGRRVGVETIRHRQGGDPAAVAYDAVRACAARGLDTVIVDTAGRLHTRANLMEELKKVRRVVTRAVERPPDEVLLVLDATTGQNALQQAGVFKESVGVTGIVLTKLDGTSKGGVIIPIAREIGIPIKFVGVGEDVEDLRDFSAAEFADALL